MRIFKKTFALSLIVFLLLSMSAFRIRANHSTVSPASHISILPEGKPQATAIADQSLQPVAPEKKPKNNLPTKTPKPTGTPPVIPPPADPGATNLMIGFALTSVIVILFGFWLNRQRVF